MKTLQNSFELNSRLVAYTALAGAALAAPAVAEATIVNSGPVNITIPTDGVGIYLNVVTGVFNASPANVPGWDVNPYGTTSLSVFTSTGAGGNGAGLVALGATSPAYVGSTTAPTGYFNLATGATVGAASTFFGTGTNSTTTPLNFNSSSNFIGFRFANEATGAINYGWMQISLSGTAQGQPRAIIAYAYENSGASIAIPVPEPSTYALLGTMAAGAVGLRAWRKRKAA